MVKAAILHEGSAKDTADKKLITSLLKHLNLDESVIFFDALKSKDNFFKTDSFNYQRLKELVEQDQIKKVLFVIDADNENDDAKYKGFDNTKRELINVITTLGFEDIADFYILCDPIKKTGYLESFILSAVSPERRQCIERFLECSQFKIKDDDKSFYKGIYSNIAFPNPDYNFAHSNFDLLKEKLTNLFN